MSEPGRLVAWALATFHTVAFVLVALLVAFRSGSLTGSLASLNTVVGFAVFLLLWGVTRYTTGRALATSRSGLAGGKPLSRPYRWGALTGWFFLAGLVVAGAVAAPFVNPQAGAAGSAGVVAFGVIATPFALVLGAIVGMLFAAIDIVLIEVARAIAGLSAAG